MIEKIVLDYLNKTLDVPAYMERPTEPPQRFVLLEKTGSSGENHIKNATFAIQSHAETLYQAAVLNENVKEAMNNIVSTEDIGRSELNSDYNFTNTNRKEYRYQAVYEIYY